jgi:pilus assembly protein CpaC
MTAATLTAIGLALSTTVPTIAQNAGSDAPVDLINRGSDVSVRSSGPAAPTGYFVAADGSIQYGDGDASGTTVTATPVVSTTEAMPVSVEMGDVQVGTFGTADTMVTQPFNADVFDAAPAPTEETVTLESLNAAFDKPIAPVIDPNLPDFEEMALEEMTIDASAGASNYYATDTMQISPPVETRAASDTYDYSIENGIVQEAGSYGMADPVMTSPIMAEPVITETVEIYQPPVIQPTFSAAPAYVEPTVAETVFQAQPAPIMAEPVFAEPAFAEPVYTPAPVSISTLPAAPVVDSYASLEPAPLAPSGRSFAARGDGSYGQSILKAAGEGPAGQASELFVGKSTVLELPTEAHEVLVSDPTKVRAVLRTARQMVLIGQNVGQTNITVFDEAGKQILNLSTAVNYDLRDLRSALARNFPGSNIKIESIFGEVVVEGATGGPAQADAIRDLVRRYIFAAKLSAGIKTDIQNIEFVDRLTTSSDDQILVKVRIAEMRRSVIKQFGVDFNLAADAAIAGATGGAFSPLTNFGTISNSFGVNGAALGGIAANIAGSFENVNFGALVQAFERHNVMRVLAEPTLTAVSGETASFLAGGQFPYPTSIDNGVVGFTFRDFGVALEFTPVVVGDGRISLTVATEISELTTEGALSTGELSIPGISVRRANTTVELPSGGTMSIAGMLLQRDANSHQGLPGLKNVFAPASDFDFFVLGRLHKVYGTGDPHMASAKEALKAPFGFILE